MKLTRPERVMLAILATGPPYRTARAGEKRAMAALAAKGLATTWPDADEGQMWAAVRGAEP